MQLGSMDFDEAPGSDKIQDETECTDIIIQPRHALILRPMEAEVGRVFERVGLWSTMIPRNEEPEFWAGPPTPRFQEVFPGAVLKTITIELIDQR